MIIARIIAPLMVAGLLAASQLREGIGPPAWVIGASFALACVLALTGRLALAAAGASAGALAEFSAGIVVTSVGMLVLVSLLGVPPLWAFALWSGAALLLRWRWAALLRSSSAPREWLALAACLAVIAAWCIAVEPALETLGRERALPMWVDYFAHGATISQLGDPRASGAGSVYLAGASRPYHYASYMLPALLGAVLDQPGLPLAITLWLPLGLLAMLGAAHALGSALGGRAGGLAAIGALGLLPDASTYLMKSGPASFHWLLFASPGHAYGLGAALLSLGFLHRWSAQRSRNTLAASALFACAMVPLRINLFLLLVPAWLAAVAWCSEARARRVITLFALYLTGALAAILIPLALQDPAAPWWRQGSAVAAMLDAVHLRWPSGYYEWYRSFHEQQSPALVYPVGVLLMYPAFLGLLLAALPLLAAAAWRRGLLRPFDAFPFLLAAVYAFFMAAAPPAYTDGGEFNHKIFTLVYASWAIWCAALAARLLARWEAPVSLVVAAMIFIGAAALWPEARTRQAPGFDWEGWRYARYRVQPGVVEAGAYLRRHALPGERFAVSGLTPDYTATDPGTQLVGLSGLPAYLARPFVFLSRGGEPAELARHRLDILRRLESAPDANAALDVMRSERIDWYVALGDGRPVWDPQRKRAAYATPPVAVYRLDSR